MITEEGELTVQVSVPSEVLPSEHPVALVIIEDFSPQAQPNGEFVVHQAGLTSPILTLRREDHY